MIGTDIYKTPYLSLVWAQHLSLALPCCGTKPDLENLSRDCFTLLAMILL